MSIIYQLKKKKNIFHCSKCWTARMENELYNPFDVSVFMGEREF